VHPESFYLELAQSAALIVGFLGGILAIRLQEQRARVSVCRQRALRALRSLHETSMQQLARLSRFVEHWPGQARFLREQKAMGRNEFSYEGDWYHPEGISPTRAGSIAAELANEPLFTEAKEKALPALQEAREANGPGQVAVLERSLARSDIELLKDRLGPLKTQASEAADACEVLRAEGRVAAHWGLWSLLIVLGAVGIVAALLYVCADFEPIKAGLTALLALLLAILLASIALRLRSILLCARIQRVFPPPEE
jgi:hypothetical protein